MVILGSLPTITLLSTPPLKLGDVFCLAFFLTKSFCVVLRTSESWRLFSPWHSLVSWTSFSWLFKNQREEDRKGFGDLTQNDLSALNQISYWGMHVSQTTSPTASKDTGLDIFQSPAQGPIPPTTPRWQQWQHVLRVPGWETKHLHWGRNMWSRSVAWPEIQRQRSSSRLGMSGQAGHVLALEQFCYSGPWSQC